jgi:Uncharacterized protein conserved in bacteria (DUF2147)
MKRLFYLVVLLVLSSSAYAGESFSFVVAGHRIRIESSSHCNSPSCVSVSIPGIYQTRRRRDRYEDNDAAPVSPPKPPAPEPVVARPIAAPASKPGVEPIVAPPSPPPIVVQPPKAPPALVAPPAVVALPALVAPKAAPQVLQISHGADEPLTPLGDWKTEAGKGSVRIEYCGRALCGYLLDPASNATAESVLINMKPKASSEWSGNVYSRDSGATYYGTMVMKGANSLRVEACAFGKFFCTGNLWSRIDAPSEKLITSRQQPSAPRS